MSTTTNTRRKSHPFVAKADVRAVAALAANPEKPLARPVYRRLAKLKLIEPLPDLFNPTATGRLTPKGRLEILWLVREGQ